MFALSLLKKKSHIEYNSASNEAEDLQKLFVRSATENKPLVIRRFGDSAGGIGTDAHTRSIDGFLGYLERIADTKPDCQIQGRPGSKVDIKDLREQFQSSTELRPQVINVLGFPLMQDPNLSGSIAFPEFLKDCDMLRLGLAAMATNFDQQRNNSLAPNDSGFCVCTMEGSFTTVHQDITSTYIVMATGSKLWLLFPDTEKNRKKRLSWKPSDGWGVFEGCFVLDTHAGDLLNIPCGWHHAVYTPQDSLMHGGHYMMAENVGTNLEMTMRQIDQDGLTNDPLYKLIACYRNLLEVHMSLVIF